MVVIVTKNYLWRCKLPGGKGSRLVDFHPLARKYRPEYVEWVETELDDEDLEPLFDTDDSQLHDTVDYCLKLYERRQSDEDITTLAQHAKVVKRDFLQRYVETHTSRNYTIDPYVTLDTRLHFLSDIIRGGYYWRGPTETCRCYKFNGVFIPSFILDEMFVMPRSVERRVMEKEQEKMGSEDVNVGKQEKKKNRKKRIVKCIDGNQESQCNDCFKALL